MVEIAVTFSPPLKGWGKKAAPLGQAAASPSSMVQGQCDPKSTQTTAPLPPSYPRRFDISRLKHRIAKKILPHIAFPVCLEANHLICHMHQFSV